MLVVEGLITDDESYITLSRSGNTTEPWIDSNYIYDATVYVECDDGSIFYAEAPSGEKGSESIDAIPRYFINTGTLELEKKYRLKIEIDEGTGVNIYSSDFSYPLKTPEIDSIFWTKEGIGHPVKLHVATQSHDKGIMYYQWQYEEKWETTTLVPHYLYPSLCWNTYYSSELLLGASEKTLLGQTINKLTEIPPSDDKFALLYRIIVNQNAISPSAYDYFANVKKNATQAGSLHAPVLSELRGNIFCENEPNRPVIGYVEIATTAQKYLYIHSNEVHEPIPLPPPDPETGMVYMQCRILGLGDIEEMFGVGNIPPDYVPFTPNYPVYILRSCVDCTVNGGATVKPEYWPR